MTLPREAWPRLKEAFEGARALAFDARAAYLAEVCNGDEALRHEVELLLAHADQAASFLETPAMPFDDSPVVKSLEGQCIGPYQVSAVIGTGGMGEVYSARDAKLNRLVAIKVLLPALANDPDRLARFSREAQLLASLNHPHIAQIHGFENAGGLHALVMELVEGPTLADRITQGAIPVNEALAIAKQIAEALEAAHAQGIIHRDLKPANIKVRPDGTVKVLDFGLAKAIDSTSGERVDAKRLPAPGVLATGAGLIVGTAAYMSPEQARRLPVDTRADIWAFGCVLYEMLTGRRPFTGETISRNPGSHSRARARLERVPVLDACRHPRALAPLLPAGPCSPYAEHRRGARDDRKGTTRMEQVASRGAVRSRCRNASGRQGAEIRTQRRHLVPPHGRILWICVSRSSGRDGHAEGVRKTDLHLRRHVARWPMDQGIHRARRE